MKRYFTYHLIISFILLVSLFTIPLFLFYNLKTNSQLDKLKTDEIHALRLQESLVEETLEDVIDNLVLLKEYVKASGESIESYQSLANERQNLTNDFKAFSIGKHHVYDQLRLLSENGHEIIRINFSEDNVQVVDEDSLQDKSHRYYFSELAGLNDNEIYISPFDLNMEHGVIEHPIKPMLRIGTPIIDADGQFSGAILINYLGRNIIGPVDDAQASDHYMILNEEGYWIKNDHNPSVEWGFMYDSLRNDQFQNKFNDEWAKIRNNEEGQFQNDLGLFTYRTVYPVRADSLQYLTEKDDIETVTIVRDRVNFWKLVSYFDNAALNTQIAPIKTERNILLVFFILISAGLAYLATRIRINELIAKKNIKDLNNNLEYEVEQRTREARKAKQEAEESNRLKTAFLNNMSHEIRTPLNGILGFTQLMVENNYNKKEIKHFAQIINKQGNSLLQIVSDILDLSKIESGQVAVHEEQSYLLNELKLLIETFNKQKAQLNKTHIDLQLDCDCVTKSEQIIIDMGKLRQLLTNLLSNAFKFIENGRIILKCRMQDNNTLLFSVSDTGIGIPEDDQKAIFERFVQSENRLTIQAGGTGLGLNIAKGITELLGGKIWVESSPDVGSTFYFTTPFKEVPIEKTAPVEDEKTENKSLEVLVVEDDPFNIEYIKEIFKLTNHNITIAVSGTEALQYISKKYFDTILMDIKLPDINGLEITKQIREINKEVKIIAQTAYASVENKEEALHSGCNDYISKPLQINKLMHLL